MKQEKKKLLSSNQPKKKYDFRRNKTGHIAPHNASAMPLKHWHSLSLAYRFTFIIGELSAKKTTDAFFNFTKNEGRNQAQDGEWRPEFVCLNGLSDSFYFYSYFYRRQN